jgi:hypothetical protein
VAQVVSWSFNPATTRNEFIANDLDTTTVSPKLATLDYGTLELQVNIDGNAKTQTTALWSDYQGQRLTYAVAITCPDNPAGDRYQQFSFDGILRDTSREAAVDTQLTQTLTIRVMTYITTKYLSALIFD